jgi:phage-related protein
MLVSKYYRARSGAQPVKHFIDQLDIQLRAKLHQHIERLNVLGETLDYPHTSQVRGELRELRAWFGRRHFRIYYQRSGRFAVLLHIIEKRGERLPSGDTALALARFADFRTRMGENPRPAVRPLGGDAP